ncbi:DUF6628 family protein [Sphingomonas montanisoli]|uniref:Uncharacterized protein n=1 Tax=Sphingomonas montanisoli TaxID=2606412 RepID=A0A5D9C482_9SPHN|nr:DUF6628 family protein [Sphingomonas montanisoli]TZG26306.1 hypothetical protein FYJ91_15320 [Sphingomonas montanisoli]
MSSQAKPIADILPIAAPDDDGVRLFLHAVRRMGAGGLNDAQAANALIGAFGLSFRRPLVLMRALMSELARVSERSIMIAPACCCRMTAAESMLVEAVAGSCESPRAAHAMFRALTCADNCLGLLSSAQAVVQAFSDLARPLEPAGH